MATANLPPALLARLQKRGVIRNPNEEVFAEDHSRDDSVCPTRCRDDELEPGGATGCPNKHNPYHLCTSFCRDHWGDGIPEWRVHFHSLIKPVALLYFGRKLRFQMLSQEIESLKRLPERYKHAKQRMLERYPLPDGWKEVYDAGVGRHYYWRPITDEVCWLSPAHPRAKVGQPAPRLARKLLGVDEKEKEDAARQRHDQRPKGSGQGRFGRYDPREERRKRERRSDDSDSDVDMSGLSDRQRLARAKRKGIDFMDPAAYGDNVPVGNWSTGIKADVKTGVDVTASGPLFQQRPLPAPGAVLRKNQGHK